MWVTLDSQGPSGLQDHREPAEHRVNQENRDHRVLVVTPGSRDQQDLGVNLVLMVYQELTAVQVLLVHRGDKVSQERQVCQVTQDQQDSLVRSEPRDLRPLLGNVVTQGTLVLRVVLVR